MQTLSSDNPDGKAPVKEEDIGDQTPTDQDPDPHNPPMRAPGDERRGKAEFHGASTNRQDGAVVEAAEGELAHTPQGP